MSDLPVDFERALVEYLLNAAWQVPLVSLAAWSALRLARPTARVEHRVWLLVLAVCVLLPSCGSVPAAPRPAMSAPVWLVPVHSSRWTEPAPQARPLLSRHRVTRLTLPTRALRGVATGYFALVALAWVRILLGGARTRRLIAGSTPYRAEPEEAARWQMLADGMRIPLPPVGWTTGIRSPVVVGLWRPMLLLPFDFWRYSPAEQRAAISHELAHVIRRDCLVHAVCGVAALPLIWHPGLHAVTRRIARSREMACDELAAQSMTSSVAYARCLHGLAERMMATSRAGIPGNALGLLPQGLFTGNKLEERVMRLTEARPAATPLNRSIRCTAGAASLALALLAASSLHLAPVLAQSAVPTPKPAAYQANVKVVGYLLQEGDQPAAQAQATPVPPPAPPTPALPAPAVLAPPEPAPAVLAPAEPARPAPPLAMAHGTNGHVFLGEGEYRHQWIAADGEPMEIANNQAAEPTPAEKQAAEAAFKHAMAKMQFDLLALKGFDPGAHRDELEPHRELLESGELQMRLSEQQAELQRHLASLDGPEFRQKLEQATSVAVARQMAEAQKHLAEATQLLNSPEMKKQLEAASHLDSVAMARRIADAQKKMDEAMRELNEERRPR